MKTYIVKGIKTAIGIVVTVVVLSLGHAYAVESALKTLISAAPGVATADMAVVPAPKSEMTGLSDHEGSQVETAEFSIKSGGFDSEKNGRESMDRAVAQLRYAGYWVLGYSFGGSSYNIRFRAPAMGVMRKYVDRNDWASLEDSENAAEDYSSRLRARGMIILEKRVASSMLYTSEAFVIQYFDSGYPLFSYGVHEGSQVETAEFSIKSGGFDSEKNGRESMDRAAAQLKYAGYWVLEASSNGSSYNIRFRAPAMGVMRKYVDRNDWASLEDSENAAEDYSSRLRARGMIILEKRVANSMLYTSEAFVIQYFDSGYPLFSSHGPW